VPHVQIMAAFELGNPMPLLILVKPDDPLLHDTLGGKGSPSAELCAQCGVTRNTG